MPQGRQSIPATLERDLKVEAGHRCAIPTCRQVPVELAHIVPWEKVQEHTFENIIALCPTCHSRFDKKEIDRKSLMRYKANLTIVNSRYGDLERRVLEAFAKTPRATVIDLPGTHDLFLSYLLADGLLARLGPGSSLRHTPGTTVLIPTGAGLPLNPYTYQLTEKGRDFVQRWMNALELE